MKYGLLIATMCFSMVGYSMGEYLSKRWSMDPNIPMLVGVFASYAVSQTGWLFSLRVTGQLAVMTAIWAAVAIVVGVLLGVCVFHERLSYCQIAGVVLAMIAVVLECF